MFVYIVVCCYRTSVLRSSQNSLQSSITGPQRPASAYYPPSSISNPPRSNLHQSIPNLKSPPATQRLQNEDSRSGSYPSVNYSPNYGPNYSERQNPNYVRQQSYGGYPRPHEELNNKYNYSPYGNSYPSPTHSAQSYPHLHTNGQRQESYGRPHDIHHNVRISPTQIHHSTTQMLKEEARLANNVRGQAKLAEMSEEVARRQNRMYSGMYQQQQVSYIPKT